MEGYIYFKLAGIILCLTDACIYVCMHSCQYSDIPVGVWRKVKNVYTIQKFVYMQLSFIYLDYKFRIFCSVNKL